MSNPAKNALVTSDDFIVKLLGNVSCCWTSPQQKSGEQRGFEIRPHREIVPIAQRSINVNSLGWLPDTGPSRSRKRTISTSPVS
jgi:hypothetical protein